ncbi:MULTISPECIES: NAD(P)/FAD-dependent oxidoreductase [Rhizobium/Agrobacterium group]|uniref:FAD-dependent oxidoreductase n=2 Tax=Rhizobium/Agrobacterium group TaxID=227290 RepID=A0A2P0QJK4_AGRTU|nr:MULTISPECIES: FAD/NAD(P)-binding oxidoreductase [Rhizobium/Agrobacterium group]ARU12449.1 pyridine nucleotide-disulfide oxidoreductase family protein [Agrobacterium tumefaciens]MBB3947428.1 NADPH-dependent 2,4-dienoyl-CoA reductase/sulfur reductase-like enzyme [Rhizobium skierniewicense]NSY52178.1 FAD-dependent oxidoreductase [Agrobacterium tumefaciens]NTB84711.1 FAD-dependent oxidoreductase [Agrobacterium tumefaciens]NTC16567.1 FAD-dependent oxidoreductase [Agrobacterium tumefaciens]
MSRQVDLLIVGAGPAGMSAAVVARRYGLDVLVVDEQPTPGGQIWRNIEAVSGTPRMDILGKAYAEGLDLVRQFRASSARYEPGTQVWQVEAGPRAYVTRDGAASSIEANYLLLATGAQERPAPFPGWTLPGVMTIGAAQIVLKTSDQIPSEPVWIAGSGPLSLLYAAQLLKAGGRIAGFLDTSRAGQISSALPDLFSALKSAPMDILKGVGWLQSIKRRVQYIQHVAEIEATGKESLERLRYVTASGQSATVDAKLLLVHEGIVPTIHPTLALGCRHVWNADQDSFAPELDSWGETSEANIFVAGDGAGIGGAKAACLRGVLTGLQIVFKSGRVSQLEATLQAEPTRKRLRQALATRPFLDKLYRPRPSIFVPPDHTIACRCEEVSVASVRAQLTSGRPGPNQIKAFTRAGMGPCQGRQCGYTIARVLADAEGRAAPDVGLYRVRPPLKPVTLSELAALDSQERSS